MNTTKNFVTKYVLEYVPDNLPWYERDGLLTYIDQLKYKKFCENRDEHFLNTEVVNFDVMHHRCRGDPMKNDVKHYKTIKKDDFKKYPSQESKRALSSASRLRRKDLLIEREL